MRVTKSYDNQLDAIHAYEWYLQTNREYRPQNVQRYVARKIAYDFVDGSYPFGDGAVQAVHAALTLGVWEWTGPLGNWKKPAITREDVGRYADYVQRVLESLVLAHGLIDAKLGDRLQQLLKQLADWDLDDFTPACRVHGDATLANAVYVGKERVVLIDPGHSRGLVCRELDEAKIMQSLWDYDAVRFMLPAYFHNDVREPFVVKKLHHVLLATHCIRLMPHQAVIGRDDLVAWACDTILELLSEIRHHDD